MSISNKKKVKEKQKEIKVRVIFSKEYVKTLIIIYITAFILGLILVILW
jgi:hypothetical protein